MMRPARGVPTVLACGACVLGVASTIALATPAHHGAHHPGTGRSRTCARRSRTHRRTQREAEHCRPARTGSRGLKPRRTSGSGSVTTKAASGSQGAGAPGGAPGASAPGSGPESGGAKGGTPPPSIPRVEVTAVEFRYTLSRTTVPAGKVIFDFVNHGQDEHNLNVQPGEGPVAGSFANTPSRGMAEQEMVLRPGTYTLFCSLPEHESKGMKATLVVE